MRHGSQGYGVRRGVGVLDPREEIAHHPRHTVAWRGLEMHPLPPEGTRDDLHGLVARTPFAYRYSLNAALAIGEEGAVSAEEAVGSEGQMEVLRGIEGHLYHAVGVVVRPRHAFYVDAKVASQGRADAVAV